MEAKWRILHTFTNRRTYALVECTCGAIWVIREDHVKSGRSKHCKSCASKATAKKYGMPEPLYKGVGDLSATFWHSIERGAIKREIEFCITIEFAWELFLKQSKKCALSGVDITLSRHAKNGAPNWSEISASLDRIDSDKGYFEDNVQWVHKTVNYIKRDLEEGELIDWCKKIAHNKGNSKS